MNYCTLPVDTKSPLAKDVINLYKRCTNLEPDKRRFEYLISDENRIKLTGLEIMLINQHELISGLKANPALRITEVQQLTNVMGAFVFHHKPYLIFNTDAIAGCDAMEAELRLNDTLAHELVHYSQWERGDLIQTVETLTWKGKVYRITDVTVPQLSADSTPEELREAQLFEISKPWEWEAYMAVKTTRDRLISLFGTERPRTKMFP